MPVSLTLFSPEEANALISFLEPRLSHLVARKRELDQAQHEIEMMRLFQDTGASQGNPDLAAREARERRARELGEEIADAVSAVHAKGCVVKDLDQGLVDFYSLKGDRIVFLCWQRGERRVAHWHSLSGGFATRRPIQQKNSGT
jgi:hypothetical protein